MQTLILLNKKADSGFFYPKPVMSNFFPELNSLTKRLSKDHSGVICPPTVPFQPIFRLIFI